jgi:predicted Fe-S protein YdhL (DUF1289 family)
MGCFRTLDDMRVWHKSTDMKKLDMLKVASARKEAYKIAVLKKEEVLKASKHPKP